MDTVVVAGATGYLGRHVVAELAARGHLVRAIVRSRRRAESPGPHGAPSLSGLVAEWAEGEVTDPGFVTGLCRGADRVISALGVTRQNANPWDVDFVANLHLLADAEHHQVRSFLYVNVMHADIGRSLLLRAKSAFAEVLRRSPVAHQVVNPSGYFSDVGDYVGMARRGVALVPPGDARVAPIHGADLARFCVDRMGDVNGSWDVGGPDVLTYPDMARLAFEAWGKHPRLVTIPGPALTATVWMASRLGERSASLAQFFAEGLTHDAVGERCGTHRVGDYFREMAANHDA
ncbi:SDR family oxidoreductase [Tessaracoccus antarcticus]|uniref:NAD-dependent epimerase/dehydratase family protein n=1 Tax=Tessaracoccus antarcticus TaxID=2479848 RepID=A0A3M0G2T7_9ACTN|nr:NAD(P)H-binding protein [Tessaracoccus antarcticus]RMB58868.1 NAD-dependent epimerase/dehydratase family protein [Tessaracoccus antarcticus]